MENKNNQMIPPYSKIKVYWNDRPENYSKDAKTKVRNYFANKYGINKNSINVVYRPVKVNDKGETIEITGAGLENIMDVNYQRALMKELIDRDGKVVDFNRILALDDKVNNELDVDLTISQHRNWSIKWIMIDNFLAFGEANYLPFNKLKGLTVINSVPENAGGKTSLTIDSIKFLLHGTTTKTDTNEQVFNTFSDKNELVVRGMIDVEGDEIIIERKMRRTSKKGGGWTIVNKVNYYELLPDGEEKLMNEDNAKTTSKKIKETIGSEKDFEMLVLATEQNLEDLIGLSTSESGKVLTRLIGLEVLETKEGIARTMYNEFAKKKKSNEYDVITLTSEIEEHERKIVEGVEIEKNLTTKLEDTKKEIITLTTEKESYINSKEKIDVTISELSPEKLEGEIKELTEKGVGLSNNVKAFKLTLQKMGEINFDEDKYFNSTKLLNSLITDKAVKEAEVVRLKRVIADLISGGVCKSCNRKLDNVDNTAHIATHESEILVITNVVIGIDEQILSLKAELVKSDEIKAMITEKHRIELNIDRAEVDMGSLRNTITAKKNDLNKYKLNLESIDFNKKMDIQIVNVKTKLEVCEYSKDETSSRIQRIKTEIQTNRENVLFKLKLIETIKKEEEIDRIFKIYIDLVGKKGISKLVLRSVLPIINSEVQRLLEDVVDFEVEIFIDDKNNVQFLLNKDGISKQLKSGSGLEKTASTLALRCVLGKLSTLPMPNFITFDEVLGRIAAVNLDKLKVLFDKIKGMYDIVFLITHNDLVRDWSDKIITVIKEDNISSFKIT